jgi:hypothetical protein
MLEQWQCSPHRMRAVRRRIYAAHLTVCRGIIEQLEQVEIDAFPIAFVTWLLAMLPRVFSVTVTQRRSGFESRNIRFEGPSSNM